MSSTDKAPDQTGRWPWCSHVRWYFQRWRWRRRRLWEWEWRRIRAVGQTEEIRWGACWTGSVNSTERNQLWGLDWSVFYECVWSCRCRAQWRGGLKGSERRGSGKDGGEVFLRSCGDFITFKFLTNNNVSLIFQEGNLVWIRAVRISRDLCE